MNSTQSYILPLILATGLHALVVAGLMMRWEDRAALEVTDVQPYYIEATIVPENPHKVKAEKEAAAVAAREQARRQREAERRNAVNRAKVDEEKARKAAEEARAAEQAEQERLAALRAEEERLAREAAAKELDQQRTEAERKRMEESLALAVMSEQEYRRAVTDDEKAMAYVAQIQREIVQNWSRPPSARNGMEALLKVRLVPTGEVVDVAVVESSGNDAFDRSAILAVQKAERFVVPEDSRQFERNFREFEVLFRPEDLRL